MTPLDLRRRIVRYLIESDCMEIGLGDFVREFGHRTTIEEHAPELISDGLIETTIEGYRIRSFSESVRWLIDTMPRTPAEE